VLIKIVAEGQFFKIKMHSCSSFYKMYKK